MTPPSVRTPKRRRLIDCPRCSQRRPVDTRGWCSACARRWRRAGRPAAGPPPPMAPQGFPMQSLGAAAASERRLERLEEFRVVRATRRRPDGAPISIAAAAAAVGVTARTGQRYATALKTMTRSNTTRK